MIYWNDLVVALKAIFGNIFHLFSKDICIGRGNVAMRAINDRFILNIHF